VGDAVEGAIGCLVVIDGGAAIVGGLTIDSRPAIAGGMGVASTTAALEPPSRFALPAAGRSPINS